MEWVLFFKATPLAFLTVIGILGLVIGSFLNVVIWRLPQMLHQEWTKQCYEYMQEKFKSVPITSPVPAQTINLIKPLSQCPHCQHQIGIWENIPILSFIFLKGKCLACHKAISWRYPLIELLTSILSILTAYFYGVSWQTGVALLLTWSLLCLTVIDIEHQLLPDDITLPMLWFGLIINLNSLFTDITHAMIGAIAGYLFLWALYWLFKLMTKKEGLGYGDFKLLAMLGAYLGWQALPGIILISSVLGSLIGITLILFKRHQPAAPLPFGPFIAIGGWIMLIWGHELNNLYLSFAALA